MSEGRRIGSLSLEERAAIERRLVKGRGAGATKHGIPRRASSEPSALSFAQQRLRFLEQLAPESAVYHIPRAMRLRGRFELATLKRALDAIVVRHEALRTTFATDGGTEVQVVRPATPVELRFIDLEACVEGDRDAELTRVFRQEVARPFDLGRDLMLRAAVARFSDDDHGLLLVMHHIASDGWSMGIFVKELVALYGAFVADKPSPLEPLPIQYADFAAWQRQWLSGDTLDTQLTYWKTQLAGAPPTLEMPTDHPRPAVQSTRGARQTLLMPKPLLEALRALSRDEGATLFMTLLAAFQTLLFRYTGQDDVTVGSPIAGRTRTETEKLIGFFVNTLVLRTDLSGSPTFRELLKRVKEMSLGAFAHQDMPFEKLVEELNPARSTSHAPLFQAMFILQNAPKEALSLPELELRTVEIDPGTTKFDLTIGLSERDSGLHALLNYSTDLFDAATMARFLRHYHALLESIAKAPGARIGELALLDAREREHVLVDFNPVAAESPPAGKVEALVDAQARRTPDAPALSFGDERLDYRELCQRANRLAHRLRTLGVGPDALVGVCLDRGVDMVVALLATLKAGGAYVPFDPSYPRERVALMLADARPRVLLTHAALARELPSAEGTSLVCLDEAYDAGGDGQDDDPSPVGTAESLAYVIYTSGSTGTPKGVAMPHGPLVNLLSWQRRHLGAARTLQFASVSFDVSFQEIFSTLSAGGELVLISEETRRDPAALLATLIDGGVQRAFLPPVVLQHVAEVAVALRRVPSALREIITAGEQLVITKAIAAFLDALPECALHNHYGPTESHVVTSYVVPSPAPLGPVPIGKPIANTRVFLLDPYGQPVPVGVKGELYIGGQCLARGYLNRPELTEQRFVSNPVASGARLYATGDLCRHREDGTLEYLGRIDHQVKIRGYRIELGEIEAVLSRHAAVREVAVLAREDEPGKRRLVAYVVAAHEADGLASELRAFLKAQLPEFMVPSAFVVLERFPVTPNGKLDRRRLPEPLLDGARGFIAPRTPIEEIIAGFWGEILGVAVVGVESDFFELGGHSLIATRVMSRVREAFHVEVPLRVLFEGPTVAALAIAVADALIAQSDDLAGMSATTLGFAARSLLEQRLLGSHADFAPEGRIPRRQEGSRLALSFAQQRLWFLEQLTPGTAVYNIPLALRVSGAFDASVLQQALDAIAERHEALRTVFAFAGAEPVQVIRGAAAVPLQTVDLQELPSDARDDATLRLVAEHARRPFDLRTETPIRAFLVRVEPEESALLVVIHHIACDGWSMGVFTRELVALYDGFAAGRPSALAPLPIQYADYALWQRAWMSGEVLDAQLAYWRKRLDGAGSVLDLPLDRPRPPVQSYRGAGAALLLSPALSEAVRGFSLREGATPFMTLLAAFQALLSRYTGQTDFCVGSPIAGRNRIETEGMIGLFTNTLVLRAELGGEPSFRAAVARVRETALGAFAHQDIPFEKLVEELRPERHTAHTPLFQVMFILQNAPKEQMELPGLTLRPLRNATTTAKFDITWSMTETPDGLRAVATYNADLFDAETIERMLAHFRTLLEGALARPDEALSRLPLLSEAERRTTLLGWNDTAVAYPPHDCLHHPIEEQAQRTPDAIAVTSGQHQLSYAELDRRANQVAHFLRARGVGPDVLVGVCMDRSVEMVVALLGVLKAGGAYVPLDPTYPRDRLELMLADAAVPVLLTQEKHRAIVGDGAALVVLLDASFTAVADESDTASPRAGGPDDLAYVIYTSGSTGKPKGAMNAHRGILNRLKWMQATYGLDAHDRVLQKTPFSFDVSVWELFWPLMVGARLVMARPDGHKDPGYLAGVIVEQGITTIHFVPSMLEVFLEERSIARCRSLERVFCSGEALPKALVDRFYSRLDVPLYNLYGPTEAAVDVTHWPCLRSATSRVIPIGYPVANTQIYVLDSHGQPVPRGVTGEIHIGGVQVGRGYWNRPELTAERFVPDLFSEDPDARLYRTGDLGRHLPDGAVEYLGRLDFQVKIRGFRIELGEIELTLARCPGVQQVVVMAREDAHGVAMLVAYLVAAPDTKPSSGELKSILRESLPEHMIPAAFVLLDALPLSPSGKIDRKALPAPDRDHPDSHRTFVAPRNRIEEELVRIWSEVLRAPRVGVADNFFELGGHSLLAVRMVAEVEKTFGKRLPLALLFENQTLERVATLLRTNTGVSWPTLVAIQPNGTKLPVFCVSTPNVNALGYVALARYLDPDQPVYGLQSRYRDESAHPYQRSELESLAHKYIEEMRSVQPHGPYFMCGMCEGANIAFEMARLLADAGDDVGLLGILDAWPIENSRNFYLWQFEAYRNRLKRRWKNFTQLGPRDATAYLVGRATSVVRAAGEHASARGAGSAVTPGANGLPPAPAYDDGLSVEQRFKQRYWPGPDFVPPTVACTISLFRIDEQPYWRIRDPEGGWGSRTTKGVEVHYVAGGHSTILREPHVRVLAEKLTACLLRAGVEQTGDGR